MAGLPHLGRLIAMTSAPPPAPPAVEPPPWQPPPSGSPDRPPLRRSRTDKVIGGVNGGLAEYTGIDPLLWRVGFVALALAGGTGVLVYLLLWLLMPSGPEGAVAPAAGRAVARREPPGPRSAVPGITLAALLIVMGVLALLTRFTGLDPEPTVFLGAALAVVGAGLVAAAFVGGRSSRGGLITLGLLLSLATAIAASSPSGGTGVGDRTYHPRTVEDVRDVYRGGVGDLTLDLSDVPLDGLDEALSVQVDHGVGDVEIVVPSSADVRITAEQGLGQLEVFGDDSAERGSFAGTGSRPWTGDREAEIELMLHNGVGDVEVSRG